MTSTLSVEIKISSGNSHFDWKKWRNSWQNTFGGTISDPTKSRINWTFLWTDVERESVLLHAENGGFDREITPEGDSKLLSIVENNEYIYEFIPTQSLPQKAHTRRVGVEELKTAALKVDLLLMTVTEIERKAVLSEMDPWPGQNDMLEGVITHNTYRFGQFGRYKAAHVESTMGSDGRDGARPTLQDAITELQPKAVLLIGIAFGLNRKKQHLGDVIIADAVFNYGPEKVGETQSFLRGGEMPCGSKLSERFRNGRHDWELKCEKRLVKAHQGLLLSGPALIANAEFREQLVGKFANREPLGGEMEGAGAYEAASRGNTEVILVKGICDWADGHKNDRAQPFAAYAAVSLAKHVLSQPDVLCKLGARDVNPPDATIQSLNNKIDPRHRKIIDSLKQGTLIPFLGHGINPHFYMDLASQFAAFVEQEQELQHESGGNPSIEEDSINRIMGSPCSVCHYHIEDRPKDCPMLKGIERFTDCPLYIEQELAVSKINLRYFSDYYSLKIGLGDLYTSLSNILEKIKSKDSQELPNFLASLPNLMLSKGYPKRSPGLPCPLIVTTNYDNILEQAFLAVNQPFDLVFYVASEKGVGQFKHRSYEGDEQIIDTQDYIRLPICPPLGHATHPRLIILKLFGIWEADGSRENFIATEQQLTLLIDNLAKQLPNSLINLLHKNNILFMGYSPSDTDLNRIMHSLWPEDKIRSQSWLLHQSQLGDLDQKIWHDRNVHFLKMPSSLKDFVTQLKGGIEAIPVFEEEMK